MDAPVRLTVWSDTLCPWCYVAAVRLDRLRVELGDRIRLEWRSFLLRPEPERRSREAFRRYTESWARPAALEPDAELSAWTGGDPPSHSVPPAVALRAAATIGADAFDRYRRALLHAYFAEHRTVSERAVLVAVAGESGLDADAFDALLTARGNELAGDVFREHADALERGIFAVPTVAVDRGGFLRGAVDLDAYRHAIALARAA